jgi:hypothetical protein
MSKDKNYWYNYDPETREYIDSSERLYAHDGQPLQPADSTTVEPLKNSTGLLKGEVNLWVESEDQWEQVEDKRGFVYDVNTKEAYYNTSIKSITAGYTDKKPKEFSEWSTEVNGGEWVEKKFLKLQHEMEKITEETLLEDSFGKVIKNVHESIDGAKLDCKELDVRRLKSGLELARMMQKEKMNIRTYDNKTILLEVDVVEKIIKFLGAQIVFRMENKWKRQDLLKEIYK